MTTSRILFVDDYRDALVMWAFYLRMRGFDVDTAGDGLSAVRLATEDPPDLIVMDLSLPGISGLEATRRLRHAPATAHIPVIATTGSTQPDELDAARAIGFCSIIIKPCDPPLLVAEIERVLAAREKAGPRLDAILDLHLPS